MGMVCDFFSESFEEYLNAFCKRLKGNRTAVEYRRSIALICDYLCKDFLEITDVDADIFFQYMKSRVYNGTLKKTTVNSRISCYKKLAAFIEEQYPESGYVNAFREAETMYGVKSQIYPSKIPTLSEVDIFLEHVNSPMYYLIFCMAFRIALSASDIISLTKRNIQKVDNGYCIHFPPKDDFTPDRIVVLPKDIEQLLMKYISELNYVDEKGHLFYNEYKNPLTPRNLDFAFRKYLKLSGLKTKYTLKDLRSRSILDMVSASIKQDVDINIVGSYVGIKELRLETYVSAYTIVDECPADLVNIQVKTS